MKYSADCLANIRLRKSIDGKGFSGVSTAEFSCDIYTGDYHAEGETVIFSGCGLSVFYAAECGYSGGVLSITAYDLCKNLDIPFDYSGYEQFNDDETGKYYDTTMIVAAIANQCGFSEGGYSGRVQQIGYLDFSGKSCRGILDDLSKADVGFWQDSGGILAFVPFVSPSSGIDVPDVGSRTEIRRLGTKSITGIYAEDELYGTDYYTGSSWKNTERFSGRYLNEERAQLMAAQIIGSGGKYDYNGWSCDSMLTDYIYNIGDHLSYGGDYLPVLSADFSFTGLGTVASVSAPEADGSFSEYHDLYSRKLEGCVAYDRLLGCTSVSSDGISFVSRKEAAVNSG